MDAESHARLRVEDALIPVKYRVFPETPLNEIIDLMVRREVRAVPVVGERFEVLGIITSGDALAQVLKLRPSDDVGSAGAESLAARDVMTRSVLCVSESQSLVDAARMMVTRDVEQLPVVREGELIGVVTRDAILRALSQESNDGNDETRDDT
jgi:CBS domain-containing protein